MSENPDFIEGNKTKEEILRDFLDSFSGSRGNDDGEVTKEEWNNYYEELSTSIPADEYFVRMMEQVWCITEKNDTAEFKGRVIELAQIVRDRLVKLAVDGSDVERVTKLFKDFDTNQSHHITIDELASMIAKLKISAERKYLHAVFKVIDTDNSGAIDLKEWINFISNDPFA